MVSMGGLPVEAQNRLDNEVKSGERVLWTGQPAAGFRHHLHTLPAVLFGIPWTAFAIFWVTMAIGMGSHMARTSESIPFSLMSVVMPLFGLPFILVGLYMISSPYWQMRKSSKTVYALTDQRAIILEPTWRGEMTVRSVPHEHLIDRTRTQDNNGIGSLTFTRLTTVTSRPKGGTSTVTVGFQNIPDVKSVDELIERTLRQGTAASS
jgi:hypothetical protein